MKAFILAMAAVFFLAATAHADIYQWKDKAGNTHITDSLEKVPREYRSKVEVRKTGPRQAPQEKGPIQSAPAAGVGEEVAPPDVGQEVYGDKTIEWWKGEFAKRMKEISDMETAIDAKRQFISVFEKGRRVGQIYDKKDVDTYERYKQEVVDDEAKLVKLKDELEELRRQARFAGVPKEVRGE